MGRSRRCLTVYLAEDLRHGRKVALKVLKPELAAVVGADRFLAEIRTTADLQHPHVLPPLGTPHYMSPEQATGDQNVGPMMVVTFDVEPAFQVLGREELFDASPYLSTNGPWRAYDVAKDDQRFLMIRSKREGADAARLVLVQSFFAEIERRVAN
jgi:serine/threonine protein kinase